MDHKGNILVVEDDASLASSLREVLADEGYAVTHIARGDEGLESAQKKTFDVVLSDLRMPGLSGIELVKQLHQDKPRLPIILMTAHGTTETAIDAMRLGAYDYLLKPFEMDELLSLLGKAVSSSRIMSAPVDLGESTSGRDAMIGSSRLMQNIFKEIGRISDKPVTVLIRGETGTGKELIARAIYQYSNRANKPFVAINCSAIPETLLESELFGHEKGAFTGADSRRIGRFEQAHGGTLFLDEIGELTPNTQSKLLRVLQERQIQRLGGRESVPVDARILAATHKDLERGMSDGLFREDLFYRLNVVTIRVPPLRDRPEDIPALINYFVHRHRLELGFDMPTIDSDAIELLQRQAWPGNVRQLENTLRKVLLASRGYNISRYEVERCLEEDARPGTSTQAKTLREFVAEYLLQTSRGQLDRALEPLVREVEDEAFRQAIELAKGNQAKAARWLGVSRLTMRERLLRLGMHPRQLEDAEE